MTESADQPPIETPAETGQVDLDEFLGAPPERPWYRRPRVIGAGLVALVAILALLLFGGSDEGSGYVTQAVEQRDLTITVSATGNLQATNEVEVSSEQSGLVTEVYVDINDRVTKGQPLARLDTSRLNDSVVEASANLASAEAQLAQYQATLAQANADLERQEEVYRISGGQVPSKTELDSARAEQRRAQAAVRAGHAAITQARAQLTTARTELSKATIYSPVSGVVLARSVETGQTVAATLSAPLLFRIAEDLSQMELEVSVDEADVGQVEEGQSATFTVDAYPGQRFDAVIKRVDLGANSEDDDDSSSSSSNVVSYTAVLSVSNDRLTLRPGMTATATIVTEESKDALVVPNSALRFTPAAQSEESGGVTSLIGPGPMRRENAQEVTIGRGTTRTIYVLGADGQPAARRVTVGSSDGTYTQILGGELKAGEQVITSRASQTAGDAASDAGPPAGGMAYASDPRHARATLAHA